MISPLLFGLGVDLPAGTYVPQQQCAALAGAGTDVSLVRVGAALADDYDWRSDSYAEPGHRPVAASSGCARPSGPAATIRRVLNRVRALHATAVVVLNGEVDDPQSAAALVRLVADRYGLGVARSIYWEIGNAPETWQHFAVPLFARQPDERRPCSPDQYAALVTSYAAAIGTALASTPDNPPRIVADEWIAFATDQSWTAVVTAVDTQYYPFNSPDSAPDNAADVAAGIDGSPGNAGANLDQRLFGLLTNLKQYNPSASLKLFVGGWNLDASPQPSSPFYGASAQAVFVARVLLHLARDGVALAAWAPPLYTPPQAPLLLNGQPTPGFRVFTALHALAGARLLPIRQSGGSGLSRLDALAVVLPDGRIAVVLTDDAAAGAIVPRLRLQGAAMNGGSVAVQTFAPATPDGVTAHVDAASRGMRVRVPALGVVVVTFPPLSGSS